MAHSFQRNSGTGKALEDVTNALKNLMRNESGEDEDSSPSHNEEEDPEYFCVEDTFLSSDLKVIVEDVGTLEFPILEQTVEKLIEVSTKAKFGRGNETVLDTSVRDTQVIPAQKLNVEINEDALSNALERISCGLNINKTGTLIPHLYNMLIYRQGQFFKMHSDSPKEKNMVATLVVVLPSNHKGGDLIIHHNNKQHIFFGSKNPNFVKCIAFYSDCQHEIRKVTDGFRVALTYNVVLKPLIPVPTGINVDENLNDSVKLFFSGNNSPEKLVFLLNHSYSENNLTWELLKGTDCNAALSLYAVAKNQNRPPCLALAKCRETFSDNIFEVYDTKTDLYFWIDDQNVKMSEKDVELYDHEVCYTMETKELFEPYKTEYSGPTGNAGEKTDNWYQRACVILWSSKWVFPTGFNVALNELHRLTTSAGNENVIVNEINKAGSKFYNTKFWGNSDSANKLIEITIYLNDSAKAALILSEFPKEILNPKKIGRLLHLETQYDRTTWDKVMKSWKNNRGWTLTVEHALSFINKYIENSRKKEESFIVDYLLQEAIDKFKNTDHRPVKYSNPYFSWYGSSTSKTNKSYLHDRTDEKVITQLINLLRTCADLGKTTLQEKLVHYVVTSSTIFTPVSIAELFFKLREKFSPNQFPFFNVLKDSALMMVTSQIPELANCSNNWYFDITISCKCKFCTTVQAFFHSKTQQRVVIPAGKDNRRHVYSHLNPLTSFPIKFHTERTGNPFKIIIEKESNVPEDREKMLSNLFELKGKLDQVSSENLDVEMVIHSAVESNDGPNVVQANNDSGNEETMIPKKRSKPNNDNK